MFNRIILLSFIAILVIIYSCTEKPTDSPVRNNPLDEQNSHTGGDPFNLTAQIAGGGILLNWQTVDIDGVDGYNIYRSIDDSSFILYHEVNGPNTASYTDTAIENGNKYSYFIVTRNNQGQESTSNTAEVEINNTPYLSIDQGDYTPTRNVDLTLLAFGAMSMQTGTPDMTGAVWVPYSTTAGIELETGTGTKTVQTRFAYTDGDTSEVVSDQIQPQPMNASFNISHDSTYTPSRDVWLYPSAQGSNLMCKFSQDSLFTGVNWQAITDSVQFTLPTGAGIKTVYAKFKNDFEIESQTLSDEIEPQPLNPTVQILPEDSAYINHTLISLSMLEVGALEMKLNTENDSSFVPWQNYASQVDSFELSTNDGLKHVYAWYRNDLFSSGPASDSIWLDTFCEVDTFFWTSTGGDTLNVGDEMAIYLFMENDQIGTESGGTALVNLGGILVDFPLNDMDNGSYNRTYTVQWGDNISNGNLTVSFSDRAGNSLVSLTAPITISTTWEKTFGGSDNDYGESVQQTTDGGYIIAGTTYSYGAGGRDFWLIKTDESGNEQWNRTFGGSGQDYVASVQQTSDGGYIMVGSTNSYSTGWYDGWLVKTDENGNEQWNQAFGGSGDNHGRSVQQTLDGGYIIAGSTHYVSTVNYDVWIIKVDEIGNEQWNQTFGDSSSDYGYSVQQTTDGGYIVAGMTDSYGAGNSDVYLIKTDTNGNELWWQTFGGSGIDRGYCVQQTTDGGYIVAGMTDSYGAGNSDVYLIKTDTNGNELWWQTFGDSSSDYGYSVQQTTDGGYIITGYSWSYGAGNSDVYLIKTDTNGNELWSKTFGGSEGDDGSSIQQTTDGGYIITGYSCSYGAGGFDVYLIKTGPNL